MAFGRTRLRSLLVGVLILVLGFAGAIWYRGTRKPVPLPFKIVTFTNRAEGLGVLLRLETPNSGKIANTVKFDGQKAELLWKNALGQISTNADASMEFSFHRGSGDPQILVAVPESAVEFRVYYDQVLTRAYRQRATKKVLFYFPWSEEERYESDWLNVTNAKTEGWFLYNPRTTPGKRQ